MRCNRVGLMLPAGLACLLAVMLLVAGCGPLMIGGVSSSADSATSQEAVPGEVLVKFRDSVRPDTALSVHRSLGFEEVERVQGSRLSRVRIRGDVSPEEAARRYARQPEVEYAEPNYIMNAHMVPTDPLYTSRQQWYYNLINAPEAWDREVGEASVVVAVLDTGVDASHADLQDALWTNPYEIDGNGIDDDANGCVDDVHGCSFAESSSVCRYDAVPNNKITDDIGHGTMVSGIIAARTNKVGVTGVAPGVRVLPVKVLDCEGAGTTAAAVSGILYAAKAGARVINISFGGEFESPALRDAIDQAHDAYGMVIVSSSGNSGAKASENYVSFPARYSKVIGVSASDHRNPDAKAVFSSYGSEVDVTAPGVDIVSTVPGNFCSENPGMCVTNGYGIGSGTSFSSPLVAGAVALLLSHSPYMAPDQVAAKLTSTAEDLPDGSYRNWDGAGRIQIDLALETGTFRIGVSGVTRN